MSTSVQKPSSASPILDAPSRLVYFLKTLFYFTKSDFKTTVFPVTVFAAAAAPYHSPSHLLASVFWTWLHILHFDVSNQYLNPDEDKLNKKDRPLPAGRISLHDAKILRWCLVPACWALSYSYSVQTLYASMVMTALTMLYNEGEAHTWQWFVRNVINGVNMGSFEVGATLVASGNRAQLSPTTFLAVALCAGIFSTTYQVADFKDIHGDKLIGRRTLPISFPKIARPSVLIGLTAWAVALILIWNPSTVVSGLLLAFTIYIGVRFVVLDAIKADQISFYYYNLWLCFVYALPAYQNANSNLDKYANLSLGGINTTFWKPIF